MGPGRGWPATQTGPTDSSCHPSPPDRTTARGHAQQGRRSVAAVATGGKAAAAKHILALLRGSGVVDTIDSSLFHGLYARELIYWYHAELQAWVTWSSTREQWAGWETAAYSPITLDYPWTPWTELCGASRAPYFEWFKGGLTNCSFNEIDRHVLEDGGLGIAVIEDGVAWGAEACNSLGAPESCSRVNYYELLSEVCMAARFLEDMGLAQGKRVIFAMSNTKAHLVWIEACKHLAVVYTAVPPAITAESFAVRVEALQPELIVADASMLKLCRSTLVQEACTGFTTPVGLLLVGEVSDILQPSEVLLTDLLEKSDKVTYYSRDCPALPVEANFPLFTIFTSGSTGKPKGVVHCHGYLAGLLLTMAACFDATPAADTALVVATPGWITGQSYMIAATLASGVTSVISSANPVYPHRYRFAGMIKHYNITIFKAGVTFLKSVMSQAGAKDALQRYELNVTLKVATFCAEPVNPAVQQFGMDCLTPQYINSYWGTEHGGIVLSNLISNPLEEPLLPDARTYSLPWIFAEVWVPVDDSDFGSAYRIADAGETGEIVITRPYPYLARTLWGDVENVCSLQWSGDIRQFKQTYFSRFIATESEPAGGATQMAFCQGDVSLKGSSNQFYMTGRSDDVINTNGVRVGTGEIEGAILTDKTLYDDSPVANVIVVGVAHHISGEVPVAFIKSLDNNLSETVKKRLSMYVSQQVGNHAIPIAFLAVPAFPETTTGKYMRRMIQALFRDQALGDTSTLRNPESLSAIRDAIHSWQSMTVVASSAKQDSRQSQVAVDFAQTLHTLPAEKKLEFMEAFVTEGVQAVVGVTVESHDLLLECGLDSLKSIRLRDHLSAHLQTITLPPDLLFKCPTVSRVADFLVSTMWPAKPQAGMIESTEVSKSEASVVSITGMACAVASDIEDVAKFWQCLTSALSLIQAVPPQRWLKSVSSAFGASPPKHLMVGAFMSSLSYFDASFFGVRSTVLDQMDPTEQKLSTVVVEALYDASRDLDSIHPDLTALFTVVAATDYQDPGEYECQSPRRLAGLLRCNHSFANVNTGCSAAHVACHHACELLHSSACELCIVGSATLMQNPNANQTIYFWGILSSSGQVKPFDRFADGLVRGEGCAAIILEAHNRYICYRADLVGCSKGSDDTSVATGVPDYSAQEQTIKAAFCDAEISSGDLAYMETHGLGTPVGDAIELEAIIGAHGNIRPLLAGSYKPNTGHTFLTSGLLALIKAATVLKFTQTTPTLGLCQPIEGLANQSVVLTACGATPLALSSRTTRYYGSSHTHAFSGVNAHVVVGLHPQFSGAWSNSDEFTLASQHWYSGLADCGYSTWQTMNYGFAYPSASGLADELVLEPQDKLAWSSIQLYWQLLRNVPIASKNVLEVGSGRGGGASFVARTFSPEMVTGLDLTDDVIQLCHKLHTAVPNLSFVRGDAQAIPCAGGTFDVVYNVESSHCYPDVLAFFQEANRVLKLGGWFCVTDFRLASRVQETADDLRACGFDVCDVRSINDHVVRALVMTAPEKEAFLLPKFSAAMAKAFREFTGMPGSGIFAGFDSGAVQYVNFICQKARQAPGNAKKRTSCNQSMALNIEKVQRPLFAHRCAVGSTDPELVSLAAAESSDFVACLSGLAAIDRTEAIQSRILYHVRTILRNNIDSTRRPRLEGPVLEAVASVGGLEVELDEPLAEAGLDSLAAIEIRNQLSHSLGVPLSAGVLFDQPTVARLATHLDSVLFSDTQGLAAPTLVVSAAGRQHMRSEQLALGGTGCLLPGSSSSCERFWRVLNEALDPICSVPAGRWDEELLCWD